MGCNRNMPKAVIYAPTSHGGIGLCHLPTEQGLQKIMHILKHLWAKTTLGQLIKSAITAYQIQAGIPEYVLENTKPLPWTPQHWITNLCNSLQMIKGVILPKNPWTIPQIQSNDHHLMVDFQAARFMTKDLQTLNNC